MNKSVLIISTTDQDRDPRVLRQIDFLKEDFDVWCCGLNNTVVENGRFIKLNINNSTVSRVPVFILRLLKLYDFLENNWVKNKITIATKQLNFDYIIANDLDTLPLAFKFFQSAKVICDFHEYAPAEFEDKFIWKHLHRGFAVHQCKKYFPKLKQITTVCDGIADEFQRNFNRRPVVITNAAKFHDLQPSDTGTKIKLIHHGVAISSRRIELMIETAKYLDDRFQLDLMLIPNDKEYYKRLIAMCKETENANVISAVNYSEIIPFCNKYDAGIFILPFTNFNYRFALPNKFFEYVQSRLGIISGPSPEMAKLIKQYELGLVADSFEPQIIAGQINSISNEQFMIWKMNSHKSAEKLSSDENKKIFLELIKSL